MRTIIMVLLGIFLMSPQSLTAQGKMVAYPTTAQLDKYPIITDTTNYAARMAEMGLHLDTLKANWTGYNWHQEWHGSELKRFVYETLLAGTEVFSDATDIPRYKTDCVNRLASLEECPRCEHLDPRSTVSDTVVFKIVSDADLFAPLATKPDTVREVIQVVETPHESSWWSQNWGWVVGPPAVAIVGTVVACLGFDKCPIRVRQVSRTTVIVR